MIGTVRIRRAEIEMAGAVPRYRGGVVILGASAFVGQLFTARMIAMLPHGIFARARQRQSFRARPDAELNSVDMQSSEPNLLNAAS
jgi:hypothetical protein